jgi:SAM-dependent methyltransferase
MIEEAAHRCGSRGRFLVADLAEPLPIEPDSLDGITCSLALHYVHDWSTPLRSFASGLRAGGWVVLSSDHPFAPPLPSQQGGYFDTELVNDTWAKDGIETTQHFWRRPLSATIGAFADAGFVVDRVSEPQPTPAALQHWPRQLTGIVGVPIFIVYRLLKAR